MKLHLSILLLFFAFFSSGCSSTVGTNVAHPPKPYNEVYYRFEKGLFLPNKYYLTIINHSERTVVFFTGHDANYLTFRNGLTAPINISRGLFDYMDKGMFWISPGEKMSIAFNIPGFEMREAVTATFKCTSGIQNQNGYVWSIEDEKALIVTYDVRTTEFSVKEGPLPVNNNVQKFFGLPQDDPFASVNKEQFKLRAQVQPEAGMPGKNPFAPLDR